MIYEAALQTVQLLKQIILFSWKEKRGMFNKKLYINFYTHTHTLQNFFIYRPKERRLTDGME